MICSSEPTKNYKLKKIEPLIIREGVFVGKNSRSTQSKGWTRMFSLKSRRFMWLIQVPVLSRTRCKMATEPFPAPPLVQPLPPPTTGMHMCDINVL